MPAPFSLCVYCGSRDGDDPAFAAEATALGAAMAEEGWRLVYGAGDVGLMGRVASAAMSRGGETLGIIPTHLLDRERHGGPSASLIITETMHERKKVMLMNADAAVLLPGGMGSLDEFWEVMTWRQLGLHDKPILLLNTAGYWDPLLALLDSVIASGFADATARDYLQVASSVPDLIAFARPQAAT